MAADQLLTTPDGRTIARFQRREADDGRPMADLRALAGSWCTRARGPVATRT